MPAENSGHRSDLDLGLIIVIVVAENKRQQQNVRVDAALRGVRVKKAGSYICWKTSPKKKRNNNII